MTGFLKLWIIAIVLVIAIVGILIFAKTTPNDNKCTDADRKPSLSCHLNLLSFGMKFETLDFNDKKDIKNFKTDCGDLQDCFTALPCRPGSNNQLDKTLRSVEWACKAIVFLTEDFSNCFDKLPEKDSECALNWNPLPNEIYLEDDEMKVKKMKENACETYFGKDDCIKKEIIERCGQEEWNMFRKQMIKLSESVVGKCDFSRLE